MMLGNRYYSLFRLFCFDLFCAPEYSRNSGITTNEATSYTAQAIVHCFGGSQSVVWEP